MQVELSSAEQQYQRQHRKRMARRVFFLILDYGILIGLAIFFLFPFVVMFVSSFKQEKQIFDDLQTVLWAFIPRQPHLDNYAYVFRRVPFFIYLRNSVLVVLLTVSAGLVVNSMLAFALARLRWWGKRWILAVVIAISIVPLETVAVPMLVMVNEFPWFGGATSWLDSLQVQIIPFIADAFSIYLFYQFFIGIPKDFDEAAMIDGASPFQIYALVTVPLSRPVFATTAILQALALWSSYLWPLMATRTEQFRPLTVGITSLYVIDVRWGPILTFASLITIPALIFFLVFQRWFIQSVASTGIKG